MKSLHFLMDVKHLKSSFVIIMGSFFILSCNSNQSSGVLSDGGSCDILDCPTPQTTISGSLGIEADQGTYYQNVDQGDVLEVAGKCNDLGVRNNRIMVEVFEGEDHPDAYIDNSRSVNCENSLTPGLNNQRCFWITQGRGIVDSGLEYPQCFNGRFSFSIKLGRIIRTSEISTASADDATNARKKYLVRFKLRTQEGAISETPWNSTLVDRGVSKVSFGLEKTVADHICKLKINAFKNLGNSAIVLPSNPLDNIAYFGVMTREFPGGAIPTTGQVSVFAANVTSPVSYNPLYASPLSPMIPVANQLRYLSYPAVGDNTILSLSSNHGIAMGTTDVYGGYILPGVRHKFKIVAFDTNPLHISEYATRRNYGAEHGPASEDLECAYARPAVTFPPTYPDNPCPASGNGYKACTITVSAPASASLEWAVIKNFGSTVWADSFEPLSVGGQNICAGQTSCTFDTSAFPGGGTCANRNGEYQIAVRHNDGMNKGAWSDVATCSFRN